MFIIALLLLFVAWRAAQDATVLVEWSTASELDTAGFNLYRGESPEGPFTQINTSLIPASTDPLAGSQYSYKDTRVSPGKLYYYQLEELELGGGSTRFGPISVRATGGSRAALLTLLVGSLLLLLAAGMVIRRRNRLRSEAGPPAPGVDA